MKISLVVFAFFAYSGIAAAQTKWEYQMVDYETKEKFEPVLKTMGEQGWEFAGCPVTGSSHYSAKFPAATDRSPATSAALYIVFLNAR